MKRYEISDHIADVRLKVEGSTLSELFNAAVAGMSEIIAQHQCRQPYTEKFDLTLESMDTTTLLIDFLSDVLTQTHLNKTLYCYAEFSILTDKKLSATIYGNKVEHFDQDVKAVTYHEAEVKKNAQGNYETIIIFDI